ncbi:MAG TPA: hypothetical protein PKC22_07450 [Rhodocyclaceae bacterium]|nr:hypothetical protein [Rhodocyclaceae bacterium]
MDIDADAFGTIEPTADRVGRLAAEPLLVAVGRHQESAGIKILVPADDSAHANAAMGFVTSRSTCLDRNPPWR